MMQPKKEKNKQAHFRKFERKGAEISLSLYVRYVIDEFADSASVLNDKNAHCR